MKRQLAALCGLLLLATVVFAQQPEQPQGAPQGPPPTGNKQDRIESLRIAFISQELNLTPAEAQKFWPVYNQYHNDLKTLRSNFKPGDGQPPSADQQIDFEQKKLDLKKKYKGQFDGCLSKDKVNRLYGLEEEFKKKVQDLRDQRQQNKGNRQGPPPGGGRPMGPR